MNRMETVDLSNCDREPIHIPGSIQTHGCLLACDLDAVHVVRHSANAQKFLGLPFEDLIGRRLEDIIGGPPVHQLRNALARSGTPSRAGLMPGLTLGPDGRSFDVAVHRHEGVAILEFESSSPAGPSSPLEFARTLVGRLSRSPSTTRLVRDAGKLLRAVLQYDRVMIYRFADDGSGQIISEAKRVDLESFMGQHFPASDIPQQARRLYLANPIRVVSNADGTRIPIEPAFDGDGHPLDLSYAHLRSVSPIHCEYLRNMGVAASMSISIIVDGALWGLIACHHYAPRALSMSQRIAAEIFGEFFSLQLETLLQKEKLDAADRARRFFDLMLEGAAEMTTAPEFFRAKLPKFEQLLPCDGVGAWIEGSWFGDGATPPADAIPALAAHIGSVCEGQTWATRALADTFPQAMSWNGQVAGMLAVPLSQLPRDYLFFFRKEVAQTIEWGGDPNKTYNSGPLGDRLTPRKSFAVWKETVEGQSRPWTPIELELAASARSALTEIVLRHSEMLAEERQKAEARSRTVNQELNHRIKNILAVIKSIVAQPNADGDIDAYVAALKGRIEALAYAHDQLMHSSGGDLGGLIAAEVQPYRSGSTIVASGPAVVLDARAMSVFAMIGHEMATNAAKYGALSVMGGTLSVTWTRRDDGACEIDWQESGGPPVREPTRRGFGTVLIVRSLPFDLGGESEIDYAPTGVTARFVIPARFVTWGEQHGTAIARPAAIPPVANTLVGKSVLLLEDEFVIALEAEDMLSSLGAIRVATCSSIEEALAQIEASRPDCAVLDVSLGRETSGPVAIRLRELGIPFAFATGYDDGGLLRDDFAGTPVIRKPYGRDALAAGLAAAIGKAG